MVVRFTTALLALLVLPASALAEAELPGFRLDAPETATVEETVDIVVTPVEGALLYGHPLDRVVGLYDIDDLDEDLRPIPGASYTTVELRPLGGGDFAGSVAAPVGDYALVPYPDVAGALPADGSYPDVVEFSVVPLEPPAPSGRPIGFVLLALAAVAIAVPVAVNRWIHRRREVDDYFERDFQDPPTIGGIWPSGGGGGFG